MKDLSKLRVAIVHDWLVGGGAERVVLELHKMFPKAPIYTSYCSDDWREKLDGQVITGWLQHFGRLRKFMVLGRIWWFTHLDLSSYDLVISSSGNGEAKGIRVPKTTKHICYCHSPTHYYWRHYDHYIKQPGFGVFDPLVRISLKLLVAPLRRWDLKAAQRPDYFIANSRHIQADIKKYYTRDCVAIYPPVEIERFQNPPSHKRHGFVTMGRQATYKRTDIIIEACSKLNLPLKVIGRGSDHERLVKMAGPSVEFLTQVSDRDMPSELASAEAFLFAAYEDFGVAPVEALATGTPVIAFKAGGALDYIVPNLNGLFFDNQTIKSLENAIKKFEPSTFDAAQIANTASKFSSKQFRSEFEKFINNCLED